MTLFFWYLLYAIGQMAPWMLLALAVVGLVLAVRAVRKSDRSS